VETGVYIMGSDTEQKQKFMICTISIRIAASLSYQDYVCMNGQRYTAVSGDLNLEI